MRRPMRARRLAAGWPKPRRRQAARRRRGDLRPRRPAAPHRGLRQLPHHGHQPGRRHDRRRAGRVRQEPVPQVQHQSVELTPGDDFAMMREVHAPTVLAPGQGERRSRDYRSRGQPRNAALPPWPDLVLIDGGQGQLGAAAEVLAELGLSTRVPLVGIAKGPDRDAGREKFFQSGKASFMLGERDPVLYLRPAPARRGASLRHRIAPRPAQEGNGEKSARRDRRHRSVPQTRPAAAFRHRQGGFAGGDGRSDGGRGHFGANGRRQIYDHFHEKRLKSRLIVTIRGMQGGDAGVTDALRAEAAVHEKAEDAHMARRFPTC